MDGSGSATIHWRDLNKTLYGRLRECHSILERSKQNVIWTAQGVQQYKTYRDLNWRDLNKTLYGRLRECNSILERSQQNVIWTAQECHNTLERCKQNVIWTAQGVPQYTGEI